MEKEILIKKRGEDGYKIISVRMKDDLVDKLDKLSTETNRSRNELINMLLIQAISLVRIEDN